jgi:hypothetical protein
MSNRPTRAYSTPPLVRLGAHTLKSGAYRYLFGSAGRKWNAMNTEQRYELLLQELEPCEATSKLTLKTWQQLMQGHKVLFIILIQRKNAELRRPA